MDEDKHKTHRITKETKSLNSRKNAWSKHIYLFIIIIILLIKFENQMEITDKLSSKDKSKIHFANLPGYNTATLLARNNKTPS